MKTTLTNQEALLCAADYLQNHGWTKHKLKRDTGEACANGVLNVVLDSFGSKQVKEIRRMLRNLILPDVPSEIERYMVKDMLLLELWTDCKTTTKSDVIQLFHDAARKL